MRSAKLVDTAPTIEIRDGLLHVTHEDGEHYASPLHLAKRLNRLVAAAIAEHDAAHRDAVVKLRKRKKRDH